MWTMDCWDFCSWVTVRFLCSTVSHWRYTYIFCLASERLPVSSGGNQMHAVGCVVALSTARTDGETLLSCRRRLKNNRETTWEIGYSVGIQTLKLVFFQYFMFLYHLSSYHTKSGSYLSHSVQFSLYTVSNTLILCHRSLRILCPS